jgi:Domain of unknown function (DUF4326)
VQPITIPADPVLAVNLHEDKWRGRGVFVGRPSILGNPYHIGYQATRQEVVERYRKEWLWPIVEAGLAGRWADKPSVLARFKNPSPKGKGWLWGDGEDARQAVWESLVPLACKAAAGEQVVLMCFCKPLLCHADVLAKCLRWLAEKVRAGELKPLSPGCAGAPGDSSTPA